MCLFCSPVNGYPIKTSLCIVAGPVRVKCLARDITQDITVIPEPTPHANDFIESPVVNQLEKRLPNG